MNKRKIVSNVSEVGARDPERKLFDELIPLPDGTSYNAYIIKGSEKTALIDTVDPSKTEVLFENLKGTDKIDYIISNHAEQDHSGSIPALLEKYPEAKIVTNKKCAEFLKDLLLVEDERIMVIGEGDTLSLGNKTLEFILAPWVHWPETMLTFLREDSILFTCDMFGSHLAADELFADDSERLYSSAKRYYAEIMMPFRTMIKNNMKKVESINPDIIAPSHGPVYKDPRFIIDAYNDWISDNVKPEVIIPYVSMHGSTKVMVEHLAKKLRDSNISVKLYNLPETDIGELAISLVDSSTIVLASSTLLIGPHPQLVQAAYLINILRPKTRFVSILGSFGWAETESERIKVLIPNLQAEIINPVMTKGHPKEDDFKKIDELAELITKKNGAL